MGPPWGLKPSCDKRLKVWQAHIQGNHKIDKTLLLRVHLPPVQVSTGRQSAESHHENAVKIAVVPL
jgi:hypothetical protein